MLVRGRVFFDGVENAFYRPLVDKNGNDSGRGVVFFSGSYYGWFGSHIYDSPSNVARALFHESRHSAIGLESGFDHNGLDSQAKRALGSSGLGGGGCWSYGFGACP
jgi:hypothetical protein